MPIPSIGVLPYPPAWMNSVIAREATCQPLAMSEPNGPAAPCTGSVCIGYGSFARANAIISSALSEKTWLCQRSPTWKSSR
jgi:hypothetical protein